MATVYKQYIVCLLLASILLQTFSQAVICIDFYANQNTIARTLCENRDKPMLHCQGRCQLRKRLGDQEEQNKNTPMRKGSEPVFTLFHTAWDCFDLELSHIAGLSYGPSLSDARVIDRASFFFHPPD